MRAIVFGNEQSKKFALVSQALETAAFLKRLAIREIVDIGSKVQVEREHFGKAGIDIRQLGYLERDDVHAQLLQCRIGFLEYPLSAVAKSGVFAAYAAHGVVPVLKSRWESPIDGLEFGRECISLANLAATDWKVIRVASENVVKWYASHDLAHHAMSLHSACSGTGIFLPLVN
jgi:hypothetical protein